ncbi:MAG: site-2 protease family protein [Coriobacteriia bacterium]|nr:site-2 protease family protein [Coriobacteriia bacterium]
MNVGTQTIIQLGLLLISITVHEYMHGYAAFRLGDPTAKNAGRLSLNPIRHIDPFGTVLLPLLLSLGGGPIFGYAKPVPVNPRYFRDIRQGDLITGVAGPAANLGLALVGAALAWMALFAGAILGEGIAQWLYLIGVLLTQTNLWLMFFNLIPIPPLDGSSVVPLFLNDRALMKWYEMQKYSFGVLMVLLWGIPALTNFNPLGVYFSWTVEPLMALLLPG